MRKKMLSLALAVCLLATVMPTSAFAVTDAEKLTIAESVCDTSWYTNDPDAAEFHISTPAQLWSLVYFGMWQKYVSFEGKTVFLDADIDLAEYPNWLTAYTATRYAFKGTLDGQNHVIFNLKGETFLGTVVAGATIKNICISDAQISGGNILASQVISGGVIDSCIVSGISTGGNSAAAFSSLTSGTVSNCITMATIIANKNSSCAGVVYNPNSDSAVVTNNASLGNHIQGYAAENTGRVIGFKNPKGTTSGNIAYAGMTVVDQKDAPVDTSNSDRNGQGVSLEEIYASGILDRLPASFPVPAHLAKPAETKTNMLNVRPGAPVGREDLGAANFVFEGLLQKNNVNLIEAEFSFDASKFTIEAVSAVSGLTVEKIKVSGADNKVVVVLGVSGTEGAFAPDAIAALVNFRMSAVRGEKPESATLTLSSATLYSKGEIVKYDTLNQSATVVLNYRHPHDVDGNGTIDAADLSVALYYFGFTSADAGWTDAASSDVNADGCVDMLDITMLVQAIYG